MSKAYEKAWKSYLGQHGFETKDFRAGWEAGARAMKESIIKDILAYRGQITQVEAELCFLAGKAYVDVTGKLYRLRDEE